MAVERGGEEKRARKKSERALKSILLKAITVGQKERERGGKLKLDCLQCKRPKRMTQTKTPHTTQCHATTEKILCKIEIKRNSN